MEQEERTPSFFRFEDLRVYAKANDYASWLLEQFAGVKDESARLLASGLCHSAFDIAINIAEGSSRSKVQFDHYLKVAKTALRECVVYTDIARRTGVFDESQAQHSIDILMELTRMIGALIISLQRVPDRRPAPGDDYPDDDSAIRADEGYRSDEMTF